MIDNAEMIKYLYHRLNNIEKKIIGLIKMINGRGEGGGEEGDIEKILSELKLEIGDLNLLKTVNKASVIEAINEVFDKEEAMAIIKVLDTLDSASTTSALSANKGRELKQLLDNKANIGDIPEVPTLDINANTRARHTHDNKNVLDKISQSKINEWDNKGSYEKPVNGIPENDLSADIKAALDKARSALQSYNENDPTVPEYVKGLTREDLERWNNKSDFSGDYNDLSNKPSLPDLQNVAYKDEIPKNVSELNNDLGYISTGYHDSTKQDKILDLNTIREGAALGKTALQSFTEADPIYSADKPNLALKSEIPTNNNQLTNGAGYQTAADVEAAIAEIIHFSVKVVDRLPDVGEDKILYLVPKQSTVTDDVYNEYVWIPTLNKYEFVGTTAVNLDDYYNKGQVDSLLNGKQNTITDLDIIREGAGKGMTAIQEHQDISGKADVGSPFNDMGETEDRETLFERVFDTEGNLFSGVDTETGNTIFIQKVIEKDGIMQGFFISSEDPEYIYKFTYSKNPYSFDISPVTFDIANNLTTNVDTMALAASQGVILKSLIDGKGTYSKPSTGIPKSDLESSVQTSLEKANTALQTHQDISGKADDNSVVHTTGNENIGGQKVFTDDCTFDSNQTSFGGDLVTDTDFYQRGHIEQAEGAFAKLAALSSKIGDLANLETEEKDNLVEAINEAKHSGGGSSVNVVDNLTSDSATDALSAKQGKALKSLVDGKATDTAVLHKTGDESASGKKTFTDGIQTPIIEVGEGTAVATISPIMGFDGNTGFMFAGKKGNAELAGVGTPTTSSSATNKSYVDTEVAKKYTKPSTGIPKGDLENSVQTSLGKADTAVQPAAISDMETKTNAAATYQPKGSYATTSQVNAKYTKPNDGIPESDLNQDLQSLIDSIGNKVEYDDIGRFDVGDSYEASFAAAILTTHSPKTGYAFKGNDTSDNFDHRAIIIRYASNILDFLYSTSEDHSLWYISLNTANNNIIRKERMVTSSEINEWSSKQDAINDLSTIRSNASNGNTAYGYFSNGKLPYSSLSGTPSIPAAQVQSDWKATSGMGVILNKPSIPTVTDTYSSTSSNAMSGKAVASAISNVKQLPSYSTANNNMVLSIVNGTPTWVKVVTIYTGTATPASSLGTDGDLYIKM